MKPHCEIQGVLAQTTVYINSTNPIDHHQSSTAVSRATKVDRAHDVLADICNGHVIW